MKKKLEDKEKGGGVEWEFDFIRKCCKKRHGRIDWCIPILVKKDDRQYIPTLLEGATYYCIDDKNDTEQLYFKLTNQVHKKPTLGEESPPQIDDPKAREFAIKLTNIVKQCLPADSEVEKPSVEIIDNTSIAPSKGILKHHISFDLGSETMAACYQRYGSHSSEPINLQEFASVLFNANEDYIDYLMTIEGQGGSRSPRLRNLVSLENKRQPAELDDFHAGLDFIDEGGNPIVDNGEKSYNLSLFGFFYKICN